jgi:hypothetical protein
MISSALPGVRTRVFGTGVHHRDPPVTPDEIELERRYCEELQQRIVEYELNPANFFRLHKRGIGRKI